MIKYGSTISIQDLKEMSNFTNKNAKSQRKQRSNKNIVSLDV